MQLAEHAEVIRTLGKRVVSDVIEIGRRLTEAKALCRQGQWLPWLEESFGWEETTAQNFMRVYQLTRGKSGNFPDLALPVSGLYLLARPSTPSEVRDDIMDRAEAGERFTHAQVQKMIADGTDKLRRQLPSCRPGRVRFHPRFPLGFPLGSANLTSFETEYPLLLSLNNICNPIVLIVKPLIFQRIAL